MNDSELLRLAAKAAGYEVSSDSEQGLYLFAPGTSPTAHWEVPVYLWNPLVDDGDAFRLYLRLKLYQRDTFYRQMLSMYESTYFNEYTTGEIARKLRRFVVESAAEIGRNMS